MKITAKLFIIISILLFCGQVLSQPLAVHYSKATTTEMQAGTETRPRIVSPALVSAAITALSPGATVPIQSDCSGITAGICVDSDDGIVYYYNGAAVAVLGVVSFQPLDTTLTDIADGTIAENLINTTNPWADNEVADNITVNPVNATTESAIELVVDLQDLQGAVTDAQVPDDITITETDPNALLTAGIDNVKDTHIDWGSGAGQVDADDLSDGSTNAIPTLTQETNWDTAYGWGDWSGNVDISTDTNLAGTANQIVLTDDTLSLALNKDIVTTSPLSDGTDDILIGADSDVTLLLSVSAADKYLYSTAENTWTEGSLTTAGRSVLSAANDAAILALLSGDAGAAFSWNSQNLTSVGSISVGTATVESAATITGSLDATPSVQGIHLGLLSTYGQVILGGNDGGIIRFHDTDNSGVETGRIWCNHTNDDIRIGDSASDFLTIEMNTGNVGVGMTGPNQLFTVENSMSLKEIADANADTAGYGQLWVHDTTPNELWFTDDAGTDTQISSHPLDAPSELYVYGPGIDWIGTRRQKLLGIIYWQTVDGKVIEESFEEYNKRRKDVPGHHDLVKLDYDEYVAKHREDWKSQWIEDNTTEVEVNSDEAIEPYETDVIQEIEKSYYVDENGEEKVKKVKIIEGYEISYRFNKKTGIIDEVKKPIYKKVRVNRYRLKEGYRMDEKTGKTYRTVIPTIVKVEKASDKDFDAGIPKWIKIRMER